MTTADEIRAIVAASAEASAEAYEGRWRAVMVTSPVGDPMAVVKAADGTPIGASFNEAEHIGFHNPATMAQWRELLMVLADVIAWEDIYSVHRDECNWVRGEPCECGCSDLSALMCRAAKALEANNG